MPSIQNFSRAFSRRPIGRATDADFSVSHAITSAGRRSMPSEAPAASAIGSPSASRRGQSAPTGRKPGALFLCLLLLWLATGSIPSVATGQGVPSWPAALPGEFANPPLLYEGPDPTATTFLPLASGGLSATPLPIDEQPMGGIPLGAVPMGNEPFMPSETDPMWLERGPDSVFLDAQAYPLISDHKDGFFQKVDASVGWIDRGRRSSFGITEVDLTSQFAIPAPTREWPMLLQPTFYARFLDGPTAPELPPELYETFFEFLWVPQLSPRWLAIVGVAPSYRGDFQVDQDEAWGMTGKGLVRFDWLPGRAQVLCGVLYVNREDIKLVPAGGLIWTPSDANRFEMIFPRPKLAHCIRREPRFEDWVYFAAEFGGNSFAFDSGGAADIVTLRDFRLLFGLERKRDGGAGRRIEIGYVFSRKAEFRSGIPEIHPPSTAFLRAGLSY